MGTPGAQAARAETVVERAARTGVITLGGRTDLVPYAFLNDQGELVGYGIDVARRIEAEVSRYLGKPVRVEFEAVSDPDTLFKQVSRGEIALSCGAQFTWEGEMFVDFSIPFSLSGIRILTRANGFSGTTDSLAGKRIAVVPGSLGEKAVRDLRPQAIRVAVPGLQEGLASLTAGRVAAEPEPARRQFWLLPQMHSEDLAVQEAALPLFEQFTDGRTAEFARRHRHGIARFGRFPHRNAALGRVSSAEQLAFLQTPGSRF